MTLDEAHALIGGRAVFMPSGLDRVPDRRRAAAVHIVTVGTERVVVTFDRDLNRTKYQVHPGDLHPETIATRGLF